MRHYKFLFFLIFLMSRAWALESEHVLWDKTPISLSLALNAERLVHFPQAIRVLDNEAGDEVAILKVQDSLYLKPLKEFTNKRLVLQLMPDEEVVILNLSANKDFKALTPVEVLLENKKSEGETGKSLSFDFNAINLTRFAIQSLYAPARLLTIPEGLSRTPMQTRRHIQLVKGASIEAHPLISWRGGDNYVTAVELKNLLNHAIILDPRHLMGDWQTASFYPTNTLEARGKDDTTTVFLVSTRPFQEALNQTQEFVR